MCVYEEGSSDGSDWLCEGLFDACDGDADCRPCLGPDSAEESVDCTATEELTTCDGAVEHYHCLLGEGYDADCCTNEMLIMDFLSELQSDVALALVLVVRSLHVRRSPSTRNNFRNLSGQPLESYDTLVSTNRTSRRYDNNSMNHSTKQPPSKDSSSGFTPPEPPTTVAAAAAAAATTTDCEVADVEITDCTITDICSVDDDDFNGASSLLVGSPLGTAILAGAAATAAGRWAPLLDRLTRNPRGQSTTAVIPYSRWPPMRRLSQGRLQRRQDGERPTGRSRHTFVCMYFAS